MWVFRAVAVDLDGTLTEGGRLSQAAMSVISAHRGELKMILVTGRIAGDLEDTFPGLATGFGAIVTENGGVLHTSAGSRPLAGPPGPALARAGGTGRGHPRWAVDRCG
jgi:hydroxymethylpyrimidine pyrophosphatase-like HAD family hydrolase